ncbi:DENN domain-containing protein 1A-like isoform X2 [Watersipora subatra]|uniref:DENN domain-containing protein 1A-like isoform X2 n=1 Tax=Watersipora subatra TaxID=2589382 RepID=UPI00355B7B09
MRTDMNTRQCANPDNLFDVFVTLTYSPTNSKDVQIDSITPSDYDAQDILNQIPMFAYPCKYDSLGVEHYTFVLTDVEAKFLYGFCRFSHDQHQIICLLSRLPWFDVFYFLLNKISEISSSQDRQLQKLLTAVHGTKVPAAREHCVILEGTPLEFVFDGPDIEKLASIPENRNLSEYYSALDAELMIALFACMLNERRILVTSKKLSKLTACCHAAASLLYPCYWQHLFIPVLPEAILDFVLAPMPYIIGVQQGLMHKVKAMELDDAVILDIDDGSIKTSTDDKASLPSESISTLRKALKSTVQDDSVSRAFLKCLVRVIGGYRDGLQYQEEAISFDADVYMDATSSSSERAWREVLVKMQYFSQFMDHRLELLNSGKGFQGEFETEMSRYFDDNKSKAKYKAWVNSMKTKGKKFKNKGQHTVINLGKRVHDTTKKVYKEIRSKLDEKATRRDDYSVIEKEDSRYIVEGSGHTNPMPQTILTTSLRPSRLALTGKVCLLPPRPQSSKVVSPSGSQPVTSPRRQSYNKALRYQALSFSDDDIPTIPSLMSDPDIQHYLPGKSFSSANISEPVSETSVSFDNRKQLDSSLLNPVAPPRRKRSNHLFAVASTEDVTQVGLENKGFSDNFVASATDVTDSAALLPIPSNPSTKRNEGNRLAPVTLMQSPDRNCAIIAESDARSSINDLIGLDLSPNTTSSAQPVRTDATAGSWEQSQPNYFVSSSSNSFASGQPIFPSGHLGSTMPSSSSSPALMSVTAFMSVTANGNASQVTSQPSRPPPPRPSQSPQASLVSQQILTPQPVRGQPADPLADLKW